MRNHILLMEISTNLFFFVLLMENPYIWEHPYATSNSLWFTPASG